MLMSESRTSSANGIGCHERHDSAGMQRVTAASGCGPPMVTKRIGVVDPPRAGGGSTKQFTFAGLLIRRFMSFDTRVIPDLREAGDRQREHTTNGRPTCRKLA